MKYIVSAIILLLSLMFVGTADAKCQPVRKGKVVSVVKQKKPIRTVFKKHKPVRRCLKAVFGRKNK